MVDYYDEYYLDPEHHDYMSSGFRPNNEHAADHDVATEIDVDDDKYCDRSTDLQIHYLRCLIPVAVRIININNYESLKKRRFKRFRRRSIEITTRA